MDESSITPDSVVQRQLEAYNRRDLQAFTACYAPEAQIFRMPTVEPFLIGRSRIGEYYAAHRFSLPDLRAEILNRMVLGNKVIDHERVWGVPGSPKEVVVVYQISKQLIDLVWLFSAF